MSKQTFDLKYNTTNHQNINNQKTTNNFNNVKQNKTFYPKTEDEAYFAILLKIAITDNDFSLDEAKRIVVILKTKFDVDENDIFKTYDCKNILLTDIYPLIDKCLNFISDKSDLLIMIAYLCVSDNKIDPREMNIMTYISNKSNIKKLELDGIIKTVIEENEKLD